MNLLTSQQYEELRDRLLSDPEVTVCAICKRKYRNYEKQTRAPQWAKGRKGWSWSRNAGSIFRMTKERMIEIHEDGLLSVDDFGFELPDCIEIGCTDVCFELAEVIARADGGWDCQDEEPK